MPRQAARALHCLEANKRDSKTKQKSEFSTTHLHKNSFSVCLLMTKTVHVGRCYFWEQTCRGRGSMEEESLILIKPTGVCFTTHLHHFTNINMTLLARSRVFSAYSFCCFLSDTQRTAVIVSSRHHRHDRPRSFCNLKQVCLTCFGDLYISRLIVWPISARVLSNMCSA